MMLFIASIDQLLMYCFTYSPQRHQFKS